MSRWFNIYYLFGIHRVEPKINFEKKIFDYYYNLSNNKIPIKTLKHFSYLVAYYQYEDYKRFWGKYPKSRKRYSKLQIKDLDHPYAFERVIDFFKKEHPSQYLIYSALLMETDEKGIQEFIIRRKEFYKMF